MKITKYGHCCLKIEIDGVTLLTDPGSFTKEQNTLTGIDAVLITHTHADHYHTESGLLIVKNNPQAVFIGNREVRELLQKDGISCTEVGDGVSAEVKGVSIQGFGKEHAEIYGTMGLVENTGFLVQNKFYFPGDAFHSPAKPVEVLALPVAGPWMKMSDAITFAKAIKAKTAFGVHDGMVQPFFRGFVGSALKMFVPETAYYSLEDGETKEF